MNWVGSNPALSAQLKGRSGTGDTALFIAVPTLDFPRFRRVVCSGFRANRISPQNNILVMEAPTLILEIASLPFSMNT